MKVDYDSPRLSTKDAELFHRHVERLMFASKRARPDIQVCVVFLCVRVKSPNKQDYKKLGKVISYLKETLHLLLVIGNQFRMRRDSFETLQSHSVTRILSVL